MNRNLTQEQQQFVTHARNKIERAIAGDTHRATQPWIDRLASETSPIVLTDSSQPVLTTFSAAQADERMLAAALQSLFDDLTSNRR
jgi:hypothetical protein